MTTPSIYNPWKALDIHASWQSRPRQKHPSLFSAPNWDRGNLALALNATRCSWTRTHSGHEARSFTSCSTRSSARRFLFLPLHSRQNGQSQPKAPAPWEVFGKPALPDQGLEGESLFNRSRKRAAPSRSPHRVPGSLPGRAPLLILEDTGSAARAATKGRALPASAPIGTRWGARSSPHLPSAHLLFLVAAATSRSPGPFPSSRCFVSDVKSQPLEQPVQAPPKRLRWCRHFRLWRRWGPARRGVEPEGTTGGGGAQRKEVGLPVVSWIWEDCAPVCLPTWGTSDRVPLPVWGYQDSETTLWAEDQNLCTVDPVRASPSLQVMAS